MVVSVCAGAACATGDVDNMDVDDYAAPHDMFISADVGEHDYNLAYAADQNAGDLDNSLSSAADNGDFTPIDSDYNSNDNSDNGFRPVQNVFNDCLGDVFDGYAAVAFKEALYFQSVKWIIPAKELNASINFWIPTWSVPDTCPDEVEKTDRIEKDFEIAGCLNFILHSSNI